jgi:hypothetical protein
MNCHLFSLLVNSSDAIGGIVLAASSVAHPICRKKCERWYHFACLGIGPGDSRLEGEFLCPLCVA